LVLLKNQRKRSKRIAFLTENEKRFLKDANYFDSKQRSKFLKSLLFRIKTGVEDLNLIFNRKNTNECVEGWCSVNFTQLYTIGQSINIRNTMQLRPAVTGKVRYVKKQSKRLRYYWFDSSAGPKQYSNKTFDPKIRFTGIKPEKVRNSIVRAYNKRILPLNKKYAMSIYEIRSKVSKKLHSSA